MKKGAFRVLVINVLSAAIILALGEIISRTVLDKIYNRDFDNALIEDHKYFDSPGLKNNATGFVWGKRLNTDEVGGRKTKSPATAKKIRLFIGDSVTEGVGVDDSSTFCYKLSEKDSAFFYRNISLIGYSSSDYLNILRSAAMLDSVSTVVLCFCLNDIYGSSKPKDLPVMSKINLVGRLNAYFQQHYATYKLLKLLVFKNANRYFVYDRQFYHERDPHFNESMNDLSICDSICKANDIAFTVLMLPYRSQLTSIDINDRAPQKMVKDFCRAHTISFTDPANHLSGLSQPASLYLFADEIHFSQSGHAAIAEFLSASLPTFP